MTNIQDRIVDLHTALESEVTTARERLSTAENNLTRARAESENAQLALQTAEQQLAGLRRAFPDQFGVEVVEVARPDFTTMTMSQKVQHVLGDRTMTLDELCTALEAQKLIVPNLPQVLYKTRHNVMEGGKPVRDPKTGALVKRATFISPVRGSWRVAELPAEIAPPADLPANVKLLRRQPH